MRRLTGQNEAESNEVFKTLTHLILDEVHEHELVTDILMIVIRDALMANAHLKVIIMSATLDSEQLRQYFFGCPVINVPGRTFAVNEIFLDTLLLNTKYESFDMDIVLNNMTEHFTTADIDRYDRLIINCLNGNDPSDFDPFFENQVPINYKHSRNGFTGLIIAAQKDFLNVLEHLLDRNANPALKCARGYDALKYAQGKCHELLLESLKKFMLNVYTSSRSDQRQQIDHELLCHVIAHIHRETPMDESILVFLPGFSDINEQKELMESRADLKNSILFLLHSGISKQNTEVFECVSPNTRKIILSTNIAETSITINDVVSLKQF